jgi:hypothetical protein
MSDLLPSALADRVDRLEAHIARLRRGESRMKLIATLLAAALVGATAIGATAAGRSTAPFSITDAHGVTRVRIDANGVHVFDGAGKERVLVGFNKSDQPVVHLNDKSGTIRESMYLDAGDPGFNQFDSKGRERASYWIDTGGIANMEFDGADAKLRYSLQGGETPSAKFGDAKYATRFYLGLSTDGDGLLRMRDASGNETVSIEGPSTGPYVRISQAGHERGYLGVDTSSNGLLQLNHPSGDKNVVLAGGNMPFLGLYDSSGVDRGDFGFFANGTQGVLFKDSAGTQLWASP